MKEKVLRAIDDLVRQLGDIRTDLFRLKRIILEDEADKTPVRPPSQSAMEAFQQSADFLKKPK